MNAAKAKKAKSPRGRRKMRSSRESWHAMALLTGAVSSSMPGRSDRQCRDRYLNHVDASVNKAPWTDEEDAIMWGACMWETAGLRLCHCFRPNGQRHQESLQRNAAASSANHTRK